MFGALGSVTTGRQFVATRVQQRGPCPSCRMHARTSTDDDFEDYYSVLGVSKNAGDSEIKTKYRELQRLYHPDIAGKESAPMSARLNKAYKMLGTRKFRIQYDKERLQAGLYTGSRLKESVEGVVGPLTETAVTIADVQMSVASVEAATDWLQQWGASFAFGCELPFQTPLQCDSIQNGLRIAFIKVDRGQICTHGALKLLPDALEEDGTVRIRVVRSAIDPSKPLPGEGLVLKTLQSALRSKMSRRREYQLGGFWAAAASATLGAIPMLNFGNQDTSYDAYQIPRQCNMKDKPQL